jgi:ABC-type antimicrobial peptide transport system permease subunit
MTLHIETYGAATSVAPAVLAASRAIDPAQPASEIRPLDQFFSEGALFGARIGVTVTAAAGGCAWLLSLAGLYACIASTIHRRRREIGIRMALGAGRWAVMRLVLAQGVRLTITGVVIGLILSAFADHWISRIVGPGGSLHLTAEALAGTIVAAACLAACIVPAWHAAREDPAIALQRN